MFKETKLRSIVKTISWRILATLTTIILVYIFIEDTTIAFTVGGIEVVLKMIVYFVHERTWDNIKFGKKEIIPKVIWITGLVRSGKSDIGELLTEKLKKKGLKTEHLDGHTMRHIFPETGFEKDQVNTHIKRVGYLAKKLEEQGVFVVASFLSPYSESREFVRSITQKFFEVYISTPLDVCESRDIKGVYKKARNGEINNFPGIDIDYDVPVNPDLVIDTTNISNEEAAKIIFKNISNCI